MAFGSRFRDDDNRRGVETADQLAWVRAIGIDEVQGFIWPAGACERDGVMRRKFNDTADVAA